MKLMWYNRFSISNLDAVALMLYPWACWGWVMLKYISKLTIIGSDNGLLPGHHQSIIWTSAGILLIGTLGTNFNESLIKIYIFSFKKMHFKLSWRNWWLFCLGLNVLSTMAASAELVTQLLIMAPGVSSCQCVKTVKDSLQHMQWQQSHDPFWSNATAHLLLEETSIFWSSLCSNGPHIAGRAWWGCSCS